MVLKSILSIFFIISTLNLFAQDTLKVADTLNRVDVNRTQLSNAEQSPMPSQTLRPDDWSNLNSTTVADAVKYLSGVQVRDYGGIGGLKTVDVRTLGANHTAVLYDGISMNNAQNGQIDLGRLTLENIEVISLFHGQPNNLLLPAKAFSAASVLQLVTTDPVFKPGCKTNLKLGLEAGSFGLFNPSFSWQQKLGSRTSTNFNAEYTNAHGEYDFYFQRGIVDTLVRRENSDIEALRLELGLQGVLADSSSWKVSLYHYLADRGLPGAAVDNRFFSEERQKERDYFIQGRWKKIISPRYDILINAKHQHSYLHYADPNFLTSDGHLENTYKRNESFLSFANLFMLSKQLQASFAADYTHQTLDANLRDFAYPTRNTVLLNTALRWKWENVQLDANALATFWTEKAEIHKETLHKENLGYSVSASWKPLANHNLYLRAFHKSIFRAPTFNDMYYTLVGSTSLRPEYVDEYNVGLTWQKALPGVIEQIQFKVDAYHNAIKDRITAIPLNSLFRWSMVNLGRVDIDGVDVGFSGSARLGARSSLDTRVNYTYQKAVDKTPDGANYNQLLPYTPQHSGAFFATGSYNDFSLSYNVLYVGERYSLRSNTIENLMTDWLVQNIAASYSVKKREQTYRIQLELNNLTDTNYQIIRSYPMPGLHYRISLQITY